MWLETRAPIARAVLRTANRSPAPPAANSLPDLNAIIGNTCLYGATSGKLFAAGSAGERFELYLNADSVVIQRLASAHWEGVLHGLVSEHAEETQSRFAKELLRDWDRVRDHFWQVCPKEMIKRLAHPLVDEEVKETA